MTLAIAHKDGKVAVLDCVRAIRPPFSPAEAVTEFVGVLKSYGVYSVTGDNYGNEILQEQFRRMAELIPQANTEMVRTPTTVVPVSPRARNVVRYHAGGSVSPTRRYAESSPPTLCSCK